MFNVRVPFLVSDVVLETTVLVSRRLEDKNESWSWSRTFALGLGLGLQEKVLQFFETFL